MNHLAEGVIDEEGKVDEVACLVYADWLDENDYEALACWLRLMAVGWRTQYLSRSEFVIGPSPDKKRVCVWVRDDRLRSIPLSKVRSLEPLKRRPKIPEDVMKGIRELSGRATEESVSEMSSPANRG